MKKSKLRISHTRSFLLYIGVAALFLFCTSRAAAQLNSQEYEQISLYAKGVENYENGYLSAARHDFEEFRTKVTSILDGQNQVLLQSAELYIARCALYQNSPDAERLFIQFINDYRPSPQSSEAALELAIYFFDSKKYKEAVAYFDQIDLGSLSGARRNEALFKQGYCYFLSKKYSEALTPLSSVSESEFYYDACYFAGHSHFYLENYDQAVAYWKIASQQAQYAKTTPYNIAQVYFAQKKYDQLVIFTEPYLQDRNTPHLKELEYLTGKSYYEMGDFDKAYTYLDSYAENRGSMSKEDYYQLGLVRYKEGKYEDAVKAFVKLDREKSVMGQSAMYYLADCFTKLNDKSSARNAFYRVSKLDFDSELQEESLMYYSKISAELEFDIEALKSLLRFLPNSSNYIEAQEMIVKILEETRDTKRALNLLESMDNLSPDLKKSYQLVAYRQGEKELALRNKNEAKDYFTKSLSYPIDNKLRALANFWLSEIYFEDRQYEKSLSMLNDYFALNSNSITLSPKTSSALAYYNLGYTHMKLEDYPNAEKNFKLCFRELPSSGLPEEMQVQIASDAGLRLADAYFKVKRYDDALRIYEENIVNRYANYDYALYQKAIIMGLQKRYEEKINSLESLTTQLPNSPYADDGLLRLGDTYRDLGRTGKALAVLEKLVNNYQGRSTLLPQAYLELGLINYNLGRTDLALSLYEKVFSHNPSPLEAKNALTAIQEIYLVDKKDPDAFLAFSQKTTGYKSTDTERDSLNYLIALNLYEQGQYKEAIGSYSNYLQKFPKGLYATEAYFFRAESYSLLKKYAMAVQDYEANIDYGQNRYFVPSVEKAALIHYNYTGNFKKAFELYSELEILASDPDTKNKAQFGAFRSAYRAGLNNETLLYANKIIHNDKADTELKTSARFYIGKVAFDRGDLEEAGDQMSYVAQAASGEIQAEARYALAYIDYQNASLETAELSTREALRLTSGYPFWVAKCLLLLSDILIDQKDYFNARAAIDAVIENYAEDADISKEASDKKLRLDKIQEKSDQ